MAAVEPTLEAEKHKKYWQRCHSTYLPSPYTPSESTRLTWACFIVSALDLLSVPLESDNRAAIRSWVLSLQHPDGGFCGSPTHKLPSHDAHKSEANIAATFFALMLLALAADGEDQAQTAFEGVHRRQLLQWLAKLQRQDGSFGQNLWDDKPVGGRDMRHSYLASCIRWMLRGSVQKGGAGWVEDVDIEAMITHIRNGQTYDGGVGETSQNESHAGYAYCGIAALSLLDRRNSPDSPPTAAKALDSGVLDRSGLLKFLAGRQFAYDAEREAEDDEDEDNETSENFIQMELGALHLDEGSRHAGFNGRWNKKADTCYYWWAAGTLAILDHLELIDKAAANNYVLEVTQHRVGGFGKTVGSPPDIYHSYLGLAVLATVGESGLKDFDAELCCSNETATKIRIARDGLLQRSSREASSGWAQDEFWTALNS